MVSWWNSLTGVEQAFACIAVPSTIILILQTILLMFSFWGGDLANETSSDTSGLDGHDLPDSDDVSYEKESSNGSFDSGLRIFTVRGFVTFFCIFGWSGLLFFKLDINPAISIMSAFILGLIFMILVAYLLAKSLKLQQDGTTDINSAIGVSGSVYITIPKARSGTGKVNAVVSGRYSEYDAVTDDNNPIPTQTEITVIGVVSPNTLVVIKK